MRPIWRLQGRTHDGDYYIFIADPSWDFSRDTKFVGVDDFWGGQLVTAPAVATCRIGVVCPALNAGLPRVPMGLTSPSNLRGQEHDDHD
jgi:hypothetical protein